LDQNPKEKYTQITRKRTGNTQNNNNRSPVYPEELKETSRHTNNVKRPVHVGIKFFSYPRRAQCARDLFACRLQRVVAGIPCCWGGGARGQNRKK
jgi:hypothetical protein